jgi:hypothetical protein
MALVHHLALILLSLIGISVSKCSKEALNLGRDSSMALAHHLVQL